MDKLDRFFKNVYRSLFDLKFYQKILTAPFSFSLKYLAFLFFVISLLNVLLFIPNLISLRAKTPDFTKKIKSAAMNFYPDSLTFNIKNGVFSTNVKQPYAIPLPKEFASGAKTEKNFIVIDTEAGPDDTKKYQTDILVTKYMVAYRNDNGYKMQFFDDFKQDISVDKDIYLKTVRSLSPYLDQGQKIVTGLIILFILTAPLLAAFFSLAAKMFYLLFVSLVPSLIGRIFNKNINYKKAYQLGMHTTTVTVLISFIAGLFNRLNIAFGQNQIINFVSDFFLSVREANTWIFLILTTFIIFKINDKPATAKIKRKNSR
jgi:hypothetical protein